MYYIDSHIHLQDYNPQDVKNVVTNAIKKNIKAFVNVSAHPSDWQRTAELSRLYPQLVPAFGVHPWYIDDAPADWYGKLENMLRQYPDAFVGECGIDRLKNPNTEKQKQMFLLQTELAHKYNRPLIIHAVKAVEELLPLLSQLPPRTIFHSYTGALPWGQELQKHGFYIGLNFSILRKKNYERLIKEIAPEHLLLETDGPYQNNIPQTPSKPERLPELAAEIARIHHLRPQELQEKLYQNWLIIKGETKNANRP